MSETSPPPAARAEEPGPKTVTGAGRATRAGMRVAGAFMLLGGLWIVLSDRALAVLIRDADALTDLQTLKGWGFVLGTALLLFFMVRRDVARRLEQEDRFSRLADNALDVIFRYRLRPSPGFEYVSPSVITVTGYRPEDYYRSPEKGLSLVHPDDRHLLADVARGHGDGPVVIRWTARSGGVVWVEQRTVPVFDESGTLVAVEGIARDVTDRNEAEARLVERAEYERSLLAASPLGVTTLDRDGTVLTWNPAAERIFGWKADEVVGHTLPIVPPDDSAGFYALLERIWGGETVSQLERTRVRKNGHQVHVSLSAAPIRDSAGETTAVMATLADITRRKMAERALAEERALLRRITETSPVGIVVTSARGRIVFANPFAEELLGLAAGGGKGLAYNDPSWAITTLDGGPFPDEQLPFRRVEAALEPVFGVRQALQVGAGRRVYVSVNAAPILAQDGSFDGIVASVEDITEQVATARSLDWSREEYRLLFENAISGVAVHRIVTNERGEPVDYVFLDVNPAFERLTGLTASQTVGRRVSEILPGIEASGLVHIYGEVASSGVPRTFEHYFGPLDKHFAIHAYRVGGDRFATAFEDVSERIRNEETRRVLERQLREAQKLEAIGRLAGGIAHDFNNMLAVIMSASDMALHEVEPDSPVLQDLKNISQAAHRSAELTRQLLAFSRKQVIRPVSADLNRIVGDQEKILRRLIGEDLRIRLELASGLWHVFIDPSQVDQILANLVVNARDAIEGSDGVITIRTANVHLAEDPSREDLPAQEGDYVLVSVSDNGAGMRPEVVERIFEPFFTTKKVGEGTGLGLSTVYGIVKQNNGAIGVRSEPGVGTTFDVHLPRHWGEEDEVPAEVERALRGTERVLVVEDEEAILALARRFLESSGYDVVTARSPGDALEAVRALDGPLHLLLTDVVLPEMNGRQLQARLRQLRPGMRTLFMSGYDASAVADRGVLDEGLDFIRKPFTMRTLARRVREVLDGPDM